MKKLAMVLILLLLAAPCPAREAEGYMGAGAESQWSLSIGLWATGLEGDIGSGLFEVPVDQSFDDTLDELDLALSGQVEFHSRSSQWGFFGNVLSMDLGSSENRPVGRISSVVEALWLEGAITYNLATRESPFDVFAGFRYWDVDTTIRFDVAGPGVVVPPSFPPDATPVTGGDDWIDFMFGGRYAPRVGENWWLVLRADYATGDSDTAHLAGDLIWRFSPGASLVFGWNYVDMDYDEGAGAERNVLDVEFSGPEVGINLTF